jgi:hypothetical protein
VQNNVFGVKGSLTHELPEVTSEFRKAELTTEQLWRGSSRELKCLPPSIQLLISNYRSFQHSVRVMDGTAMTYPYISFNLQVKIQNCKIRGFHGGNYEECRLLGYKNTVRTSQETHYVSTTESSQLMLCKIRGFHGGDYEECRLVGYKNPVRTSQETHYVSATESSRLMLCKI